MRKSEMKFKSHRRTQSASLGPSRALDNKICRGNPPAFLVLICIFGSCWLVVDYWKTQARILNSLRLIHVDETSHEPITIWSSAPRNTTTEKKNKKPPVSTKQFTRSVYLVNVHNAGSSIIQMILNRYAAKYKLKVSSFNSQFGMPYPKAASPLLLYEDPVHAKFQPYDVLHEHAIYDEKTVEGYMRPGYKLIGSLREPLSQIRSLFEDLELGKRYGIDDPDVIEAFLKNPESHKGKTRYDTIKNCQAQHYGYRLYKNNQNVSAFIEHIDNKFDMILIAEKIDESLVLLKRKFNWSLDDIMYLWRHQHKRTRKNNQKDQETKTQASLKLYSKVDYEMYDYFSRKLKLELDNQTSQFWQQLDNFKSIKSKFNKFCNTMCDVSKDLGELNNTQARHLMDNTVFHVPGTLGEKDLTLKYTDCILLAMSPINWQIALKVKQFTNLFCSPTTRGLKEKSTFYDPHTETIKEDHQGVSREVTPQWCNERNLLAGHFPSRTVFLDLFTKQTTTENPYCLT